MKGFRVICLKCGSENVGISGFDTDEEGISFELYCYQCGSSYEDFFGNYKEGKLQ